jgi:hypothetical protein
MAPDPTGQAPNLLTENNTVDQTQWGSILSQAESYLTFDANSSSSGTSPHFFGCTFTSAANSVDFLNANDVLQDNHKGLLLGLNTSNSATSLQPLTDVVTAFGVTGLGTGTMSKIVSEVGKLPHVQVVASSKTDIYRNGLWIIPQDAGKLQVRSLALINGTFFSS